MTKKNIRELLRLKKTMGRVGIEIEVEGQRLPNEEYTGKNFNRFWRVERDGSLRGEAYEYVLKEPVPVAYIKTALRALEVAYERRKSNVHDSVRAGVHVHINVQELTKVQLANFITSYLILEEALVKFCGENREGNLFCLRVKDAESFLYSLDRGFKSNFSALGDENIRYAAINLNALYRYGSIEFRSMRSTRDLDQIELWAKMLHRLMEGSQTYDNPRAMIDSMSSDGVTFMMNRLIGEEYTKVISYSAIERDILRGVRNAQDLAYSTDWDSVDSDDLPTKKKSAYGDMIRQMTDTVPTIQTAAGMRAEAMTAAEAEQFGATPRPAQPNPTRWEPVNIEIEDNF